MNAPMTVQVPSVSIQVLHRRPNTSEKGQAMKQRTPSAAGVTQASVPLDARPDPKYYCVGVAAHLPDQWKAMSGVISLTQDVTPAGLRISTLELAVDDHTNLLQVLTKLHEDQRAILWVNALR
jgi:hypothetical protein